MIMGRIMSSEAWAGSDSALASLMFIWAVVDKFIPSNLKTHLSRNTAKTVPFFNLYIHVTPFFNLYIHITGGERIIVFTTNHTEKLDPAPIRTGRMYLHIELSYCSSKVLAKNYLGIESHPLFEMIGELMGEVCVTPADVAENLLAADVAENLLAKSADADTEACLQGLVDALVLAKAAREIAMAAISREEEIPSDDNGVGDNNGSEESM